MPVWSKSASKYNAKKAVVDGITFDSKKEAKRYAVLKMLEKAGNISNLERQVKFRLLPSQREPTHINHKGKEVQGKVLERPVDYIADFVYKKDGEMVVEDTKGIRTRDYVIKRKLMLWVHGIRITEI